MGYELTGNPISSTYIRLVQHVSDNYYDGAGNILDIVSDTSLQNYVAKAGDTMTGDLTINSSLAVLGTINASYGITGRTYNTTGGLTYVSNLDQYTMSTSSITGTLRIALPGGVAVPYCHISFRLIIVPQGGSPQNINISGLWLNGAWNSCAAYSTSAEVRNLKIRFARDASTRYILIGESATVWTRTMYKVENALIGYFDYPYNTYKGPYTISIDTTDASGLTVDRTVKNSDLFAANLGSLSLVADLSANDWTTIATIDGDIGTTGLSGRGTIMLSRQDQAKMVFSFSKSYTNVDLTLDSLTQYSNNVIQGIRITSDYKIQLKAGTSYVTGHVIKLLNSDGYVTLVKQASSGAETVLKQIDLTTAVNGPIFTNNIKTQGSLEVGSIAGKLGIGTTTPNDMLDVSGNVIIGNKATALKPYLGFGTYWNGSILRSDLQGNTFGHYILSERATTAAASKLSFGITSSAGATDLFNVTGDGKFSFYGAPNLGIITLKGKTNATFTAPVFGKEAGDIHILPSGSGNDSYQAITFGSVATDTSLSQSGIYMQSSRNYGSKLYLATTNSFSIGAQARLVIDNLGKVGIGEFAPTATLDVSGNVNIDGSINIKSNIYADGSIGFTGDVTAGQTMRFKNGILVEVI